MTKPEEPKTEKSKKFTPRNVAKYAVKTAIKYEVSLLAKDFIVDHTDYESDDTIVRIGAYLIGWGVSANLEPYTDKAVDKTADFASKRLAERKTKRQAKKAAKKDTEKTD